MTEFLIAATKDISKAHPEDKAACTIVKHKALEERAADLLKKTNLHDEENKATMAELEEVSKLIKSHEKTLAKAKQDL